MTLEINGYVITGTPAEMRELLQMDAPKKAEAVKAETAQKPVEKKPAAKKKQIDWGKAQALRNAGWSYDKIGEELKVSGVTISAHLKKMEAQKNDN